MPNIYHDLILDHYNNPRNFGALEKPDVVVLETNSSCGDEIEMFLTIDHQLLTISQLRWRGRGCAISMAGASLLSEQIGRIGQIRKIRQISERDVVSLLGGEISSGRMRCATLALVALRKALLRSE